MENQGIKSKERFEALSVVNGMKEVYHSDGRNSQNKLPPINSPPNNVNFTFLSSPLSTHTSGNHTSV